MSLCYQCPRLCGADRDISFGYCSSPSAISISKVMLHGWEEPCLVRGGGAGTIFFSGCNLGCVYCQNYEISHEDVGKTISKERLSEIFDDLKAKGAHNINLVNPTHYADAIADVLRNYKSDLPIVYNSSGYERVETLSNLEIPHRSVFINT